MKRKPSFVHVAIALGLIAALAIASPVFGVSKSIKKTIRKEVAKQIGNAKGPAGATNVVVREAPTSTQVTTGSSNNSTAECVGNERAVGGGALWEETATPSMPIVISVPLNSSGLFAAGQVPTKWFVRGGNTSGADKHLRAQVICASP